MTKKSLITLITAAFACFAINTVMAAEVTPLLKTSTSWDGSAIEYPKGDAEISAMKISLAANESTPYHCHPVPTFGYILSGSIKVTKPDGSEIHFKQGDAVAEVMKHQHAGHDLGQGTEILVFYAGQLGQVNTLKAGDKGCEH